MSVCLNCGRSENEMPLLIIKFKGEEAHICSECFPLLIHNPSKLDGKLPGPKSVKPSSHEV